MINYYLTGYNDLGAKGEGSATSRVQRSAPVLSAAGKRAKEGFAYWYQERPKPTSCEHHNHLSTIYTDLFMSFNTSFYALPIA